MNFVMLKNLCLFEGTANTWGYLTKTTKLLSSLSGHFTDQNFPYVFYLSCKEQHKGDASKAS